MRRFILLVLCLVLCAAGAGLPRVTALAADDAAPEEKPPPPPVRRIYDVTDLVTEPAVEAQSSGVLLPTDLSPPAPHFSGNGPGPPVPEPSPARIEQLIKLLTDTVDPDTWKDNGGSAGSIRTYETRLIVTAAEQTHDKLVEFLADLRESRGRSVRIRATWAALSEDELRSVLAPSEKDGRRSALRAVDLAAVEHITGAIRYRAEINCLNGQRVNVLAGRARSVLTDMEANVGTETAAMAPVIELILSGASLAVTPAVSADGSTATLNLRAVTGRWDKSDTPPIKFPLPVAGSQPSAKPPRPPPPPPSMDWERLNMPVHLVATTAKVPIGVAAIVGGMTADAEPQHADDHRPVYLIMEVWAEGSNQQHNHSD